MVGVCRSRGVSGFDERPLGQFPAARGFGRTVLAGALVSVSLTLTSANVCVAGGDESCSADLSWAKRCNIERIPFREPLRAGHRPYIVQLPRGWNSLITQKLQRETLLEEMGNATCTPSQAGNIRRGIHNMELREYVEEWMQRPVQRDSEENKYVFGEFGDQWAPLRDAYRRPPCKSCSGRRAAVTIGLGGLHTGAPWHFHNAVFVEVMHGAKHFAILPPKDPDIREISEVITNLSQYHWHVEKRPEMEVRGQLRGLQECVIHPGELLYFPDGWHHGVVNMAPYTAFVSTFVERDEAEESGDWH